MAQTHLESDSTVWCAGSTVFTACGPDGTEFCLWLQPDKQRLGLDLYDDRVEARHGVRFTAATPVVRNERVVPLLAVWWRIERDCSPSVCQCGPVPLATVLNELAAAASTQALAAHVDLLIALEHRLTETPTCSAHAEEIASALSRLTADLAECIPTH